jgi:hypothetical protein
MSNSYGEGSWSVGNWGNQASSTATPTTASANVTISSVVADGTVEDGWSRRAWGSQVWGDAYSVLLTGVQSNTNSGSLTMTGDALVTLTGVEAPAELGQAIGEPESIYPVTGVQSNTATGTLEAQEGHGVTPTGVEMVFADGSETVIATVDAGWGRNTWGSFAWNVNIEFFANVTGESMSTFTGTVSVNTGEGVIVPVIGEGLSTAIGNFSLITNNLIDVTGLPITVPLANPTILADGNVTTSAPGDQMDFAIGTVDIVASHDELVTGQELSTSLANVTIESRYTVSGVSMQFADGDTTETASALVTPTGIEMSVVVGNMRSTPWANVVTGASNTWTSVAA